MKNARFQQDPVCGRRMNRNKAYAVIRYGRQEVLLCCPLCQAEFEADPERFLPEARRPGKAPVGRRRKPAYGGGE